MGLVMSQTVWAYKEADLQQLLTTNSCRGCDLSKVHLNLAMLWDTDLTEANLTDAHLIGADLRRGLLTKANLTRAVLSGVVLYEADLTGVNLTAADLTGAWLDRAKLLNANLAKVDLANDKEVSAIKGLVSLVGGKLTTYRSTSEEVAKLVARKLSQTEKHVHSEKALLPGGDVEAIREIESWFPKRHSISNRETSRLIDIYGSRTRLLSELIDREKSLGAPIGKKSGPLKAEVIQGFESEKAETLVDLLARRMMLTWTPSLGLDSAKEIAVVASQYLGWSRERVSDELKNYETFVNQFRAHLEKRPL